jgi:hypothetical protein
VHLYWNFFSELGTIEMYYEDFIKAAENAHLSKFSSLVLFSRIFDDVLCLWWLVEPRNRFREIVTASPFDLAS